jgi:Na+-driven multidrug efflux pump
MASLSIFMLLLRRLYCHKYYPECKISFKKYFSFPLCKEISGFAGWSFLGSSSTMIANYGQGIVINTFFGTIVNAAQGIVAQLSGQLGAFAVTMLKALNPIIAKSEGAGNRQLMLKASMAGSKMAAFLLSLFYVPMLIETEFILKLWLKNVPEYTVIFCRLLLIRNIIEQLYIPLSTSIAAVGKIKHYQIFASLLSFSSLIASFIFFKLGFPPYSLYIIFIFYSLLNSCLVLYFAKINCGLSVTLYMKEVVLRALGSFVIIGVLASIPSLFLNEGIIRVCLTLVMSSFFFMITFWIIGLDRSEKISVLKILTSIKNKIFTRKKSKNENIQTI